MTKEVLTIDVEVSMDTRKDLELSFSPFFDEAKALKERAEGIVVTSEDQADEMKEARELRLQLKKIRVETEKKRKEMKDESLRKGKAIDGMANIIKFLIVPLEEHLQKQEDFVKVIEEKRKAEIKEKRIAMLESVNADPTLYRVDDMDEDTFNQLYENIKKAEQDRINAEKQAQEERERKEKEEAEERERIRKENEKLKKEAEERERLAEAERKEREEKERKEREAHEAILKKEREEKEKLEAEIRAKEEAERKAKQEAEEKARKEQEEKERAEKEAKLAPDKKKLEALSETIACIVLPDVKSAEAKQVIKTVAEKINQLAGYIKSASVDL